MATVGRTQTMNSSIVMDMENADDSDYEVNFMEEETSQRETTGQASSEKGGFADMKKEVQAGVASYMWERGRQRAKQAFNVYANIDIFRPYFDVEPQQVRQRLMYSFIPQRPGSERQKVHRELYGPSMVVLTLIALLLFQMKSSGHMVEEGTLMGTAFGTCFGYWMGVSGITWMLAYICNTHISMLQLLSLLGYAMFGHCIVLFLATIFHPAHGHFFFYMLWAILGGLSTLKMVSVLTSRTAGRTQKMIICGFMASIHLLFLLYLHFAYHHVVEEISSVIDRPIIPEHVLQETTLSHTNKVIEKSIQNPPHQEMHPPDFAPEKLPQVTQLAIRTVGKVIRHMKKGPGRHVTPTHASKIIKAIAENALKTSKIT